MLEQGWLQLSDYSNKYKVSVSTLRRRIKSEEVEYQFDEGKYWLPDRPIEKYVRQRPVKAKPVAVKIAEATVAMPPAPVSANTESFLTRDEALEITHELVSELKAAFKLVLQEKEEALVKANGEVANLQTLCHMLESENEKLKAEAKAPLSGWFIDEEAEA